MKKRLIILVGIVLVIAGYQYISALKTKKQSKQNTLITQEEKEFSSLSTAHIQTKFELTPEELKALQVTRSRTFTTRPESLYEIWSPGLEKAFTILGPWRKSWNNYGLQFRNRLEDCVGTGNVPNGRIGIDLIFDVEYTTKIGKGVESYITSSDLPLEYMEVLETCVESSHIGYTLDFSEKMVASPFHLKTSIRFPIEHDRIYQLILTDGEIAEQWRSFYNDVPGNVPPTPGETRTVIENDDGTRTVLYEKN